MGTNVSEHHTASTFVIRFLQPKFLMPFSPMFAPYSVHFIILQFMNLSIFDERYKLQSFYFAIFFITACYCTSFWPRYSYQNFVVYSFQERPSFILTTGDVFLYSIDFVFHKLCIIHTFHVLGVLYKTQPKDDTCLNTETSMEDAALPLQLTLPTFAMSFSTSSLPSVLLVTNCVVIL